MAPCGLDHGNQLVRTWLPCACGGGLQKAPANQIALAEYSGLVFVTLFGVMWFDEIPDILTLVGISLIVIPMMPIKWKKVFKWRDRAALEVEVTQSKS